MKKEMVCKIITGPHAGKSKLIRKHSFPYKLRVWGLLGFRTYHLDTNSIHYDKDKELLFANYKRKNPCEF